MAGSLPSPSERRSSATPIPATPLAPAPARGRPPTKAGAPHGEQEVRAALLDAATELFGARGPSHVTIREIAAEAGVNHGLVHHYFGSKDALLAAVLDRLATESAEEIAATDPSEVLYTAGSTTEQHGRILAHLLLEGRDPGELQSGFPAIRALVARLRDAGFSTREARERAAGVTALVLGWHLFEPFLVEATRLDLTERSRQRLLDDGIGRMLR